MTKLRLQSLNLMPEYGAARSGARALLAAGQCPVRGCGRRVIEVFASTLGFPLVIVEYDDEPAESLQKRRQAEGERVPADRAIWCRLLTEPTDRVPEAFACPLTVEAPCSRHARLGTAVVDRDDLRRANCRWRQPIPRRSIGSTIPATSRRRAPR